MLMSMAKIFHTPKSLQCIKAVLGTVYFPLPCDDVVMPG